MKKTEIKLSSFPEFNRPLVVQISDDPNTDFARVIVSKRELLMNDIQQIELVADTYYINTETGKIVPQMTHRTLSKGKPWIISNDYDVIVRDGAGEAIPNPEFDSEREESEENSPFLMQPAYDRFAGFLYNEKKPVSLPVIWKMSVLIDDAQGFFNIYENDKLR